MIQMYKCTWNDSLDRNSLCSNLLVTAFSVVTCMDIGHYCLYVDFACATIQHFMNEIFFSMSIYLLRCAGIGINIEM